MKVFRNTKYEAQGMGYQWGRKDPLPLIPAGDTHAFYREDGTKVAFTLDEYRTADAISTCPADGVFVRLEGGQ